MSDTTYNGWKNHATWLVSLWLDDADFQLQPGRINTRYEAKEELQSYVDMLIGDRPAGLAEDLIRSSLSDVDWYELADKYLELQSEDNEDE